MNDRPTLGARLRQTQDNAPHRAAVTSVVEGLAVAAVILADIIARGPLGGITGAEGATNFDGDRQKDIDIAAHDAMSAALRRAPVAAILSEESDLPDMLDPNAPLVVAIDPLDGSANLENNISIGTIFSIRPRSRDALSAFFEPGTAQSAAGFFVYGPQTLLILAIDGQVDVYILDRAITAFVLVTEGIRIALDTPEFAVNASNRRHWSSAVRGYIDACLIGAEGERGRDHNMRWIGSLVAEAYRILVRGGVFLYPADARPGYREGRLRLLYEAHPMALVMEWAGGAASTGRRRILDVAATTPHQRVPLIMGAAHAVRELDIIHEGVEPLFENSDSPLFARRGLFR